MTLMHSAPRGMQAGCCLAPRTGADVMFSSMELAQTESLLFPLSRSHVIHDARVSKLPDDCAELGACIGCQ